MFQWFPFLFSCPVWILTLKELSSRGSKLSSTGNMMRCSEQADTNIPKASWLRNPAADALLHQPLLIYFPFTQSLVLQKYVGAQLKGSLSSHFPSWFHILTHENSTYDHNSEPCLFIYWMYASQHTKQFASKQCIYSSQPPYWSKMILLQRQVKLYNVCISFYCYCNKWP